MANSPQCSIEIDDLNVVSSRSRNSGVLATGCEFKTETSNVGPSGQSPPRILCRRIDLLLPNRAAPLSGVRRDFVGSNAVRNFIGSDQNAVAIRIQTHG